jgi:hypothetical protein
LPNVIKLPSVLLPESFSGRWRGNAIQEGSNYQSYVFFDIKAGYITMVHVGVLPTGCPVARAHNEENLHIPIDTTFTISLNQGNKFAYTTLTMSNTFFNTIGAGQAVMTIAGYCGPGTYKVSWNDAIKIIDY